MTEETGKSVEDLTAEVAALAKTVRKLERLLTGTPNFTDHPFVTMSEGAKVAPGVRIMAEDESRRVVLGKNSRLYRGCEVVGPMVMGDYSFINRDGYIRAEVTIGQRVSIGPFVRLVSDNHDLGPSTQRAGRFHVRPIEIESGVWIGACVTILGGVTVGAGAVVAAGALVIRDVPPNTVVAGVPARVVRHFDGTITHEATSSPVVDREARRAIVALGAVMSGVPASSAEQLADTAMLAHPDMTMAELAEATQLEALRLAEGY